MAATRRFDASHGGAKVIVDALARAAGEEKP